MSVEVHYRAAGAGADTKATFEQQVWVVVSKRRPASASARAGGGAPAASASGSMPTDALRRQPSSALHTSSVQPTSHASPHDEPYMVSVYAHLNHDLPLKLWPIDSKQAHPMLAEPKELLPSWENKLETTALPLDDKTEVTALWQPRRRIILTNTDWGDGERKLELRASDGVKHDRWLHGLSRVSRHVKWQDHRTGGLSSDSSAMKDQDRNAWHTALDTDITMPGESAMRGFRSALLDLRENLHDFCRQPDARKELTDLVQQLRTELVPGWTVWRRLTTVFLQLTSVRMPDGHLEATVPRRSENGSVRWLDYTRAYANWMLTFSKGDVLVTRFPQPPVVRVRAIMLCCDISDALMACPMPSFK